MVLLVLVICGRCSLCIALSSNRFFESLQLVVSHLLASGVRLGAIHLSFLPFTWNLGFGFSGSAWLQFRACELITVSRFGRLRCHFYTSHMFSLGSSFCVTEGRALVVLRTSLGSLAVLFTLALG